MYFFPFLTVMFVLSDNQCTILQLRKKSQTGKAWVSFLDYLLTSSCIQTMDFLLIGNLNIDNRHHMLLHGWDLPVATLAATTRLYRPRIRALTDHTTLVRVISRLSRLSRLSSSPLLLRTARIPVLIIRTLNNQASLEPTTTMEMALMEMETTMIHLASTIITMEWLLEKSTRCKIILHLLRRLLHMQRLRLEITRAQI